MSLVSTLLLGLPVSLPKGLPRSHCLMEAPLGCNATRAGLEANARVRAANVAAVMDALESGCGTLADVARLTGLSLPTVRSVARGLVDAGRVLWLGRGAVALAERGRR